MAASKVTSRRDDDDDDFVAKNSSSGGSPLATVQQVPGGYCLASEKWRGTALALQIDQVLKVKFMDGLGVVDFQPSQLNIVLFLSEADVGLGLDHIQLRLARLYKQANRNRKQPLHPVVIFHRSELTQPYLVQVQSLAVLDFTIPLVPVTTTEQFRFHSYYRSSTMHPG